MVRADPRPSPVLEVRPTPSHGARPTLHRCRKRTIGHPAINRRATQAGQLENRGQPDERAQWIKLAWREVSRRVGLAAIHGLIRVRDLMNLDRNNASQRDDFLLFFVADELMIGTSLLVSKVRR